MSELVTPRFAIPRESDHVTSSMWSPLPRANGGPSSIPIWGRSDLGNDMTRAAIMFHDPDHREKQQVETLFDGFSRREELQFTP